MDPVGPHFIGWQENFDVRKACSQGNRALSHTLSNQTWRNGQFPESASTPTQYSLRVVRMNN